MTVPQNDHISRLVTLALALTADSLTASVDHEAGESFVRVINPDAPTYRDRVTVRNNHSDGYALWFYTSWGDPIAPARDVRSAVRTIRTTLTPKPGARQTATAEPRP